jgi:acetyltransferase
MAGAKRYNPEARIEGVTIQFFIRPPDFELLVGFKRNDNFGPVLLFGLGGIFTEVLRDRNLPCRLSTA